MASGASGSHRRWAGGTALAGIALLLVACGGGGSPALGGTTAYQKALAYSQCMRAHGVPSYPDPTYRNGRPTDQPLTVYGINPDSPAVQSAERVCGRS